MATSFSSQRAIAPMLWVLVALSGIELVVVHALIAFWWPALAIGLSIVTLGGIVWLVAVIRSFATRPSVIEDERVTLRAGRLFEISFDVSNIGGIRTNGLNDSTVKARNVFNLALIAFPNVIVDLTHPVRIRRRSVTAVAHRFDDLPAFVAAVTASPRPDPEWQGRGSAPSLPPAARSR